MAIQSIRQTRQLPPLIPGVKLGVWRRDDPQRQENDREYALIRRSVLERDSFTCQWCSFQSVPDRKAGGSTLLASGYLEEHHLDDNHANNDKSNLATICPFCHMVFHIGFAGHQGRAKMIYMPWLTQEQLSLLVNGLAVAVSRGGELGDDAESLLIWLNALDGPIAQTFGDAMTDPASLATALMGLHKKNPKLYAHRNRALAHVRVLPAYQMFDTAVQWWSEKSWIPSQKWAASWLSVFEQWKKACAV